MQTPLLQAQTESWTNLLGEVVIDFRSSRSSSLSSSAAGSSLASALPSSTGLSTLTCSLFGPRTKLSQHFPTRLVLERTVATKKLSSTINNTDSSCCSFRVTPVASSRTTQQSPSSSSSSSSMDLSTLNVLLLSLKSCMWLRDDADPGRRFLFQPRSSTTAYLVEEMSGMLQTTSITRKESQRHRMRQTKSSVIETKKRPSTAAQSTLVCRTAWMHSLPRNSVGTIMCDSDFEETYSACLARNDPSPVILATQIIPLWLLQGNAATLPTKSTIDFDDKTIARIRMCLKKPTDDTLRMLATLDGKDTSRPTIDHARRRRDLELQVLLRLICIAMYGTSFQEWYAHDFVMEKQQDGKGRKKHKRHKRPCRSTLSPCELLLEHVTDLLSAISLLLPSTQPLSSFLRGAITPTFYRSIPDTIALIYEVFEVTNPFVERDSDEDDAMLDLEMLPSQKNVEKTTAATATPKPEPSAMAPPPPSTPHVSFVDENSWMRQSVALTTSKATKNPLLSTSKPKYVASHFNTKLSNINNLFREASVNRRAPPPSAPRPRHGAALNRVTPTSRTPTWTPSLKQSHNRTARRPSIVSETPMKRSREPALSKYTKNDSRRPITRLVSETPCKPIGGMARSRASLPSFASESPLTPTLGESQSSLHFVAEAAQAAKRKNIAGVDKSAMRK